MRDFQTLYNDRRADYDHLIYYQGIGEIQKTPKGAQEITLKFAMPENGELPNKHLPELMRQLKKLMIDKSVAKKPVIKARTIDPDMDPAYYEEEHYMSHAIPVFEVTVHVPRGSAPTIAMEKVIDTLRGLSQEFFPDQGRGGQDR